MESQWTSMLSRRSKLEETKDKHKHQEILCRKSSGWNYSIWERSKSKLPRLVGSQPAKRKTEKVMRDSLDATRFGKTRFFLGIRHSARETRFSESGIPRRASFRKPG